MAKSITSSNEIKEVFLTNGNINSSIEVSRFKCVVAYDGTDFCGWQSQLDGRGIQDFLENRLCQIFKQKIRIHGSGRTDAGVHAVGQVFHFDAKWNHSDEALLAALQSTNRIDVRVKSLKRVAKTFHARYGATGKRYVYHIYLGRALPHLARYIWSLERTELSVEKMNAAAEVLLGTHDFTAFSASRGKDSKENPVKTITKLCVMKRGAELKIIAQGSGFMYKMVRMLTGALVAVGMGKLTPKDIKAILNSKKRGNYFQSAPAQGLFLEKVFYTKRK